MGESCKGGWEGAGELLQAQSAVDPQPDRSKLSCWHTQEREREGGREASGAGE